MRCGLRRKVLGKLSAKAALSRRCNSARSGKVAMRAKRYGLVGGGVAQGLAGIGERSDSSGRVKQQGEQQTGPALGSVVAEFQMVLEDDGGAAVELRGGEGKILWAHGSLL